MLLGERDQPETTQKNGTMVKISVGGAANDLVDEVRVKRRRSNNYTLRASQRRNKYIRVLRSIYFPSAFVQSVARSKPCGCLVAKLPVSYTLPGPMLVSTTEQRG